MEIYHVISALIFLTMIFAYVNARFIKWPSTIGIMALSLITSILLIIFGMQVPWLANEASELVNAIDFKVVLLEIMLSFLLFAGAVHIEYRKLRKQLLPVLMLATVGTLISTFAVGAVAYYLLNLFKFDAPFIHCLLFGALISPTDPIAVLGILKKAGIPESLEMKIAGESLFNDGVAVVVFLTILQVATTGTENMTAGDIGMLFLREAIGGLIYGGVLGYVGYLALKSIDNYKVEVLITLVVVMCGYALADAIHVSAPLAMVVTGILIGNKGREFAMSEETRDYLGKFWNLLDEILNAMLFMLLGLEMLVIQVSATMVLIGVMLIVLVLISRFVSVFLPIQILRKKIDLENNAVTILTWGGLRGGISVALALSLPTSLHRNEWVLITYIIVVFSIIVQGLTIGNLAKKLLHGKR
ncbi:cation:proton antiporter [Mucilaginibacter lacusdianchii]|uniref:cation:proton antiporter n=1 Tax=Mucilaginibacter lacusdianchii TaxID=2684211 RepID=UPI00131DD97F|nr:sodium:proton antiporter [Mucilaginibacter sp. JXJ CY 39]